MALAVCFAVQVLRAAVPRPSARRHSPTSCPTCSSCVTTALRSGYGLTQALDSVAEEAEEPARSEFAHVLVEIAPRP